MTARILPFDRQPAAVPLDDPNRLAHGDLRRSTLAECQGPECRHRWWAPLIGNCPRCGLGGAVVLHEQELDYVRV